MLIGYDWTGMRIGIDGSRAFGIERTGTEMYSYRLISSLMHLNKARRHSWVVYLRGGVSERVLEEAPANWTFRVIAMPRLWTQCGLALRTWIDRLDLLWVPAHTLPVLRRWGLKSVVTVHGLEYQYLPHYYGEWARWHLTWSTEYAVRFADRIIAVSQFTRDELVGRLRAQPSKVRVVYEGVTGFTGIGSREDCESVLGDYGLLRKQYLLFVGTIQPRKNLVRLIEAFSRLKLDKGFGALKLVIVGGRGWQCEEVFEAPRKFGVEDRVIFTGYISDAKRSILMQFAMMYVQPSLTEGFGLPVLEAMGSGVPVVSSWAGALGEVVGEAGVMFDPLDLGGMESAMRRLIEDADMRRRLVRLGKERVKNFSWEKAARVTLDVFEELDRPGV